MNRKEYDLPSDTRIRVLEAFELDNFDNLIRCLFQEGEVLVLKSREETGQDEKAVIKRKSDGQEIKVSYRNLMSNVQMGNAEIVD